MRTIKINLKMCFLTVVAIIFGGIFSITAYASEDTGKKNLSEETKSKIERIKEEYPDCRNYIDSVILFYEEHSNMSEDINQNIIEAIEGIELCNMQTEERYKEEFTEVILNQKKSNMRTASYDQCLANYALGIQIVKAMGAPQTAKYMEHAIVPQGSNTNPSDYISSGDAWAEQVCNSDSIMCDATEKFETKILANGKVSGTINGSVTFNKDVDGLDLYTALHKVSYTATFSKKANGYYVYFYVTDVYDFAWNRYDNFAVDFANNYCYAMQSAGYIKPFNIAISYAA